MKFDPKRPEKTFEMVLSDWGSSSFDGKFGDYFGGTPYYAGPLAFEQANEKDVFSFGRFALEVMFTKEGMVFSTLFHEHSKFKSCARQITANIFAH